MNNNLKRCIIFSCLLWFLFSCTSGTQEEILAAGIPVQSISLIVNPGWKDIQEGYDVIQGLDIYSLEVITKPQNQAFVYNFTISNSDPSVLSVTPILGQRTDPNALRTLQITPIKKGTSVVTLTDTDSGLSASYTVSVGVPKVTGITFKNTTMSLNVGEQDRVLALPVGYTQIYDRTIIWSSSNTAVATVADDGDIISKEATYVGGLVTAVSPGTAIITGKTKDGGYTSTCTVTVNDSASFVTPVFTTGGFVSSNINKENYTTYGNTVNSYLIENNDNTYTRLEYVPGSTIIVEQYDSLFNFISSSQLPMELPLFGGFYAGSEYNFVVFGQENPSQNDSLGVYRVVKYSKTWIKLGEADLAACNTIKPFAFGSLRMTEYGNILYIRTCHIMYKTPDGYNHQSNITFSVSIPNMLIVDNFSAISSMSWGYVSHSFNQFIQINRDVMAAVDQGDAYPRSLSLTYYQKPIEQTEFFGPAWADEANYFDLMPNVHSVKLMPFAGDIGNNSTNASIGGFEVSNSSFLVAGNSIIQDNNYMNRVTRNIFVIVTPLDNPTESTTQVKWITNYPENENPTVSTPHFVKIDDNNFLLMWSEGNDMINYVLLDGNGDPKSDIRPMRGNLSDCQPIETNNGKVVWYVTDNSTPVFYSIDPSNTVVDQFVNVSGLSDKTYGDPPFNLIITPDPKANLSNFTFSSSNPAVAQIDNKGQITINGIGTTNISVTEPGNGYFYPFLWTHKLTVSSTINVSELDTFESVHEGYTQPPAYQWVTITNTGTNTITIIQPTAVNYDIGELYYFNDGGYNANGILASGDSAAFSVQPKVGLSAGNHNETINISAINGTGTSTNSVYASFTVTGTSTQYGDVNHDSRIDLRDATLVMQ